jgi:hypothetical protein
MNKRIILTALALLFISLLTMRSAYAPLTRLPGVSPGDYGMYGDISATWSSTDPTAQPPDSFKEINDTQWLSGTVSTVVGTNVTFQTQVHFNNGTTKNSVTWVDVDTGQSGSSDQSGNMSMFILAANLNETDPIYSGVEFTYLTINETVPINYPGGARMTNHLNVTLSMNITFPFEINFNMSMNYWWDKTTGVMTEMAQYYEDKSFGNTTTWSMSIKLTDSNKWTVPEFSTPALFLTLIATATTITLILKPRLRTKKP